MPVSFYVDPAMLDGRRDTREVGQITLSYTFFIDREATAKLRAGGGRSTSRTQLGASGAEVRRAGS